MGLAVRLAAPDEAAAVSDHLPVWAEFSVYEGGTPLLATQPAELPSR